jgi:hypothetical protein
MGDWFTGARLAGSMTLVCVGLSLMPTMSPAVTANFSVAAFLARARSPICGVDAVPTPSLSGAASDPADRVYVWETEQFKIDSMSLMNTLVLTTVFGIGGGGGGGGGGQQTHGLPPFMAVVASYKSFPAITAALPAANDNGSIISFFSFFLFAAGIINFY